MLIAEPNLAPSLLCRLLFFTDKQPEKSHCCFSLEFQGLKFHRFFLQQFFGSITFKMSGIKTCVIADIGGKSIRIGTADFDLPLVECLAVDERELYSIQGLTLKKDTFYEPVVQHGIITDWEFVEAQLRGFIKSQKIVPSQSSIVFTQSLATSPEDKQKVMHVVFEKLGFESICIASDVFLAFIASGKKTGIILQVGHTVTEILPFIDGEPLFQYATCHPIAGQAISYQLSPEINDMTCPDTNFFLERDDFKEQHCYVPENYTKEFNQNLKNTSNEAVLSRRSGKTDILAQLEKQRIAKFNRLCFEVGEIWFKQDFGKIIVDTIAKCPVKFQDQLYQNIILSGGTAGMKGFSKRLEHDLQKRQSTSAKVTVIQPQGCFDNAHTKISMASFCGGVLLARDINFGKMLTKRDAFSPAKFQRSQLVRSSRRIKTASVLLAG